MKIQTRDFGTLEIDPAEVICFHSPVYGFDELKNYTILSDDSIVGPFTWLQSLEDEKTCFILVDPLAVMPQYTPTLSPDMRQMLQLNEGETGVFRVIAVIPENFADTTVNLKSPIIINPVAKCAAQVILEEDYPVRARLIPQKEAKSC